MATGPAREASRFWTYQALGWLTYFAAMTFSRIGMYPLPYMLVSKGVLALAGFLVSLVLWRLYRRLLQSDPSVARMVAVSVIASYVGALAWTATDNVADLPIANAMLGRSGQIRNVLQLFFGSVYNAFTLLAWSLLYFGIRYQDEMRVERERALRAEASAQQARLEALRYQLHPHFLFNTLNAISTLVVERRNDQAGEMIARLSEFLRLTLSAPVADEVPLAEELDFIERYLEIEQVRFGDRLKVRMDITPEAWKARVPHLVLQPAVENAIRHGLAPREEGGTIGISATRENGRLRIVISNDGSAAGSDAQAVERIGLGNTRERLRRLYGDRQALEIHSGDTGTRVILELPFETVP